MLDWGSAFSSIAPFFLLSPAYLHESGHSSVLHIGSNPVEASSSGQTDEGPTVWLWWFTGLPQGSLLSPWIRARAKLMKFSILAALNI